MADRDHGCCPDGRCEPGPKPISLDRRRFLTFSAAGAAGAAAALGAAGAPLGAAAAPRQAGLAPADKGLSAGWLSSLRERGQPTTYSGNDLKYIGMPVGGGCCGQLYLGGDGKLWLWDVINTYQPTGDAGYANPRTPSSPFGQGFLLRTTAGGRSSIRSVDGAGFSDVRFTGQYPIGHVEYRGAGSPVEVSLDAFSPFVPLEVDDSTLPVTMLSYTLRNTSSEPVDAELLGWSESPVCLNSRGQQPITLSTAAVASGRLRGLQFTAAPGRAPSPPQPDILFEDFEKDTYQGWTVEGQAFGAGPVRPDQMPPYFLRFGDLHIKGTRFVTSHDTQRGQDVGQADAETGKLTSRPFTIERRYVSVLVGGGSWAGRTCVNVVVDGKVVASATGDDSEPLKPHGLSVHRWQGKTATIEIVDSATGGWGHVNCDDIVFTDQPVAPRPFDELPDAGSFTLAALDPRARVRPSIADWSSPQAVFDSGAGPSRIDGDLGTIAGTVGVPIRLAPGESTTVRFLVAWYFPVPDRGSLSFLRGSGQLLRHYAGRFDSAAGVARHVAGQWERLERQTRLWVDTWYTSSTLPHWLLERTLATASTLATSTCYRFHDGRFYAWEGVGCCAGTCEHVWNYAQAVARLFPQLERDTRERVDLDIGFNATTGEIGNRAEADMSAATDGECGTILRIYREHLTSADSGFLRRVWPRVKKAIEFMMEQDARHDGTLEGPQPNTLDAVWYGEVAWLTGMYDAALRAGAEMADAMGDAGFAGQCRRLADAGAVSLSTALWTGEYFRQIVDPAHPEAPNSNLGCHVDQLFGQSLAWQLGLPRAFPVAQARTALESVYRYNFVPDPARYRQLNTAIPGGRWFAMAGEPAVIMTTFPHGGAAEARGNPPTWQSIYFNEAWTGQEYQLAAHMLYEGLADAGLTITRAVHDRYAAGKRNPYNEIECGDHYARAMAGYGVFLAACGYEYDGPRGHIGFAPRVGPEDFRAAFTAAEGWGVYRQRRQEKGQTATLEVRHGRVAVRGLAFQTTSAPASVTVRAGHGRPLDVKGFTYAASRVEIELQETVTVEAGSSLDVAIRLS
jgi:non-lysosomal glucosylceramidase